MEAAAVPAIANGTIDAVVTWFTLEFGGSVTYSSAPWAMPYSGHWTQMLQPTSQPVGVAVGDTVNVQPYAAQGGGGHVGVRARVSVKAPPRSKRRRKSRRR